MKNEISSLNFEFMIDFLIFAKDQSRFLRGRRMRVKIRIKILEFLKILGNDVFYLLNSNIILYEYIYISK